MVGDRTVLWYLIAGTRGGPNRLRILQELQSHPFNAHQLADRLALDYRTVRHHLRLLEESRLVFRPLGVGYAAPYELSPHLVNVPDLLAAANGRAGSSNTSPAARSRGWVARGGPA